MDLNGKAQPLPAVRGMAYDPDPAVRKAAYEAELASYRKIETPMAFCLSCIKGEALTMCEAKGYSDVLSQQLPKAGWTTRRWMPCGPPSGPAPRQPIRHAPPQKRPHCSSVAVRIYAFCRGGILA